MLSAEQITVRRSGKALLSAVSARFEPRKLSVISGPNGAGKTTLLRVLTGDLKPDEGQVKYADQYLAELNLAALAKQRAVLAQHSILSFDFSVEEVVMLGRIPHLSGWETEQDRRACDRALAMVEMDSFRHRSYLTLSGGEQQRVHLARVLAQIDQAEEQDPEKAARWLLLDEPTAALDLRHQHNLLSLLKTLCKEQGHGVLAVLHDLNLAIRYADQVLLLADGALVAEGTPAKTITAANIEHAYGVAAEILMSGQHNVPVVNLLG